MSGAAPADGEPPGRGAVASLLGLVRSGVLAALVHPLASVVTVLSLAAMLAPLLTALAVSRGMAEEAARAETGLPDILVTAHRFGRTAPVPLDVVETIRNYPGVRGVEPRITAATSLGKENVPVVVVGVPRERLAALEEGGGLVEGRMPRPGSGFEAVVGSALARRLGIRPGAAVPPFYRNDSGERFFRIVGIFRDDLPPWQAHTLLTDLRSASIVFAEEGHVTTVLVTCPQEYLDPLRDAIRRIEVSDPTGPKNAPVALQVVTRDEVAALRERLALRREGALALVVAACLGAGVPLVLATTGIGLAARRRDTGLLRSLGWSTDAILLRGFAESLFLAIAGASVALLLAWTWIRVLRGAGIVQALLPDATLVADFALPSALAPEAVTAAFVGAVAVASAGTLLSSWRAASAPPSEALR